MNASPTAAPLFGADAARLTGVLEGFEERAGREQLEALGRGRPPAGDDEVVELARAAASGTRVTGAAPGSP